MKQLEYARRGWYVFPLLPKSKAPATPHGFHDASNDEEAVKSLWGSRTNLNIGLATGEKSGCWILDVDAGKGGLESIEAWENKYGSMPETLTSLTGGGGKHYFFNVPKNMKMPSNANKLATGIDLRGEGGYAAIPPSVHPNGSTYRWENENAQIADAPAWLLKLIAALKHTPVKPVYTDSPAPEGDWTTEDVISMLYCISADDRETWRNVGMALHDSGWPFSMWDSWSRKSEKYGGTEQAWRSFKNGGGITMGTLVHMAEMGGWVPKERPLEKLDFSNVDGVDFSSFNLKKPVVLPEVKTDMNVGGLIGDTLSWINSTAFKLQPELTIMNTIAAMGAIFGRRYALQKYDTRTNVYMVGIAETGQGKDNSRQMVKKLMRHAGLEIFCGPDEVRSAPGLMIELKKRPSLIVNMDEIGMVMRALFDPKSPVYLRDISKMLTILYSSSRTSYEGGLVASSPENRIVLNQPNLCIYGTTTLSSYSEAMRTSSIKSGELNRFIIMKSPVDFPERNFNMDSSDPPEALISRWKQFAPEGYSGDIIDPDKTIVLLGGMTDKIHELYRYQDKQQEENMSNGLGNLWVRYVENILKVAMIISIARDHKNPVLSDSDIEFGKSLVGSSLRFMMKFATDNMYDSEFQKKCSEFMDALSKGITSRTKMNAHMRIKPKELDEIERALKEMDKIGFDERERPRKYEIK